MRTLDTLKLEWADAVVALQKQKHVRTCKQSVFDAFAIVRHARWAILLQCVFQVYAGIDHEMKRYWIVWALILCNEDENWERCTHVCWEGWNAQNVQKLSLLDNYDGRRRLCVGLNNGLPSDFHSTSQNNMNQIAWNERLLHVHKVLTRRWYLLVFLSFFAATAAYKLCAMCERSETAKKATTTIRTSSLQITVEWAGSSFGIHYAFILGQRKPNCLLWLARRHLHRNGARSWPCASITRCFV